MPNGHGDETDAVSDTNETGEGVDLVRAVTSAPVSPTVLTGENDVEREDWGAPLFLSDAPADGDDDSTPPATRAEEDLAPTDTSASEGQGGGRDDGALHRRRSWASFSRRQQIVGGVVVLVVIALVAVLLIRSGSRSKQTASGPRVSGVIDNFSRPDRNANLGATDTGRQWQAVRGVWGIQGHAARVVRGAGDKPSIAVVDMGASDGLIRVTEKVAGGGAGLVFRYVDPANYWTVQAAPGFGTWTIWKVIDGKATQAPNTGLSTTQSGTTVSVQLRGPRIEVFVNGTRMRGFDDSALQNGTHVGLIAGGTAAESVRFADFVGLADRAAAGSPASTSPSSAPSTPPTTKPK